MWALLSLKILAQTQMGWRWYRVFVLAFCSLSILQGGTLRALTLSDSVYFRLFKCI
jgi:hypothetical protein